LKSNAVVVRKETASKTREFACNGGEKKKKTVCPEKENPATIL
jgi:hypothetical protein